MTAPGGGDTTVHGLTEEDVRRARGEARRFTAESVSQLSRFLRDKPSHRIADARTLVAVHHMLLFVVAFPHDATQLRLARMELDRLSDVARALSAKSAAARRTFVRTGVAGSTATATFSHAIAEWLAERYPQDAELEWLDPGGQPLHAVLRLAGVGLEEAVLTPDPGTSSEALLADLTRAWPGSRLRWLVDRIRAIPADDALRAHLFESLRPAIEVRLDGPGLAWSSLRGLPRRPFFHRRRADPVDALALIRTRLPNTVRPPVAHREGLLDAARGILVGLERETEAITSSWPGGVEHHQLERGVSIALYWMAPGRRPPLDTHVGFMLFSNEVPVAYGGGWPFLGLCRIGVSVFEPYRGGPSSYLFAQVLRVYAQRFRAERFVVEPFQFGEANREAIASGAFWFYRRLGFRPVDPPMAALAEREEDRRAVDPSHRSSAALLRRLTGSDLELVLPGATAAGWCDPNAISYAVTDLIRRAFHDDRALAERAAFDHARTALGVGDVDGWPEDERRAFVQLSPLLTLVSDLERWSTIDRRSAVALMRAKGAAREQRFLDALRSHRRLRAALLAISPGPVDRPAHPGGTGT
jgi:hypothetical protein